MKNKKIAIKDFVKTYKSLSNEKIKENEIDTIIVRHYAPITEKKAALDLILKKCIQEKDGIEYIDSFLMQVGLMSAVLSLYTNLDCNGNMFENYDLLMEDGIYPIIKDKIGEKDVDELMNVYYSVEETFYNQHTFKSYVANQVTRFGELAGTTLSPLLKVLIGKIENLDENKLDDMINIASKFSK